MTATREEESRRSARLAGNGKRDAPDRDVESEGGIEMKIQIKRVEAIKATRIHLDPDAGGA